MSRKLGTIRAIYVVALSSIGSFLFAYDMGIIGTVLTLASFQRDFRYTREQKTEVNSHCVSLLQAGAFLGCICIWPITSRFGRRVAIIISSLVFCIGAVIQTVNIHSLGAFYAGRVISGLGTGAATVIVPMYTAEVAPKEIRGKLGAFFQLFFTFGVFTAYWVDYGASTGLEFSSLQWQVPIALQLVPGGLLLFGMLVARESPRWLVKRGRKDDALNALLWIRGGTEAEDVQEEYTEILAGIGVEVRATKGWTWKELLLPANRLRMFIAITLQLGQQMTGNTSLTYYAPQIFATIGAGNKATLITCGLGIVKVVGVVVFITLLVERMGRRLPFILGAFTMGCLMLTVGIIVAKCPPEASVSGISVGGAAAIAMVYLVAFSYNWSWGPLTWLYIGEIFPLRIREIGISTGAASQWLWNFVMSQITPRALAMIGWKTFLMFAIFNFAIAVYSYIIIRETKGKSLEQMEVVFGTVKSLPSQEDLERVPLLVNTATS